MKSHDRHGRGWVSRAALLSLFLIAAGPGPAQEAWTAIDSLHHQGYLLLQQEQEAPRDPALKERREHLFAEAAQKLEAYLDLYVPETRSLEYLRLAYQVGLYHQLAGRPEKAAAWYDECLYHPLGTRPEGARIRRLASARLRELKPIDLLTEIESRSWSQEGDVAGVKQAVEGWAAALRAKSTDQLAPWLAEDVILLAPACSPLRGREAVLARYREMFAGFTVEPEVAFEDVQILDGAAVAWSRGTLRLRPVGGGPQVLEQGDDLCVLQNDGKRWQLVRCVSHLFRCTQPAQKGS